MPIPASQLVSVQPGVVSAGGSAQSLNGLVLTTSTRIPIGAATSFSTSAAVGQHFGAGSIEQKIAAQYFLGYNNSSAKPGTLWFAQFPWAVSVPAYLQGGSMAAITLAQLQAISGTLIVTIDGITYTSSTFNLGSANSFSAAAGIIQTALGATDVTATGSIAPAVAVTAATSTIAGTTLTIATISSGAVVPGAVLTGSGVATGTTVVSQLTGTAGAAGTYQVSIAQTTAGTTITATNANAGVLTLSAATGTVVIGQNVNGTNVLAGQYIQGFLAGTGGTGTYIVPLSQTVTSEAITLGVASVTFDGISQAFIVTSGTLGSNSAMSFATGTTSGPLKLTSAQGAIISQGSNVADPATFMNSLVQRLTSFFSVMTAFTPIGGGQIFALDMAQWVDSQDDEFLYVMPDPESALITNSYANTQWGLIQAGAYNGTLPIYVDPNSTTDPTIYAAAVCGFFAALDFTQQNGRQTLAYRRSPGLVAQITRGDWALQLTANNVNFYGTYGFLNSPSIWQDGGISGVFLWADTYAQAVQLKGQLQTSVLTLLENVGNVPYNTKGNQLIAAACQDPINQMLNYGGIQPGVTLSALQKSEVNTAAGTPIDAVLFAVGWYLQIGVATAAVRAARQSPPITLWYTDGQSVQSVNINSIVIE